MKDRKADGTAGDVVLVVGREADLPAIEGPVVRLPDPETAAQRLYAVLRDCDERGARRLLVLMPPDEGAWAAIRDRLCRATTAG